MNELDWTRYYDNLTIKGLLWRSDSSYDFPISGEVQDSDGIWRPVVWTMGTILPDLVDAANTDHNVAWRVGSEDPVREVTFPARAFGVPFVPSATRDVLAAYEVEQTVTRTLLGSADDEAVVALLVDGLERGKARHLFNATLGLGQAHTHTQRRTLRAVVLAGSSVLLNPSGSGASTLVSSTETLL